MSVWLTVLCGVAGAVGSVPLDRVIERSAANVRRRTEEPSRADAAASNETSPPAHRTATGPAGLGVALAIVEGVAAARLGATWSLLPAVVAFAGLAALAFCDARHFLLPRRLLYPVVGATVATEVFASLASHEVHQLLTALVSGTIAFGAFFLMNLISPRAMAFGDVRLAGAVGLFVGWYSPQRAVAAFVIGTLLAGLISVGLLVARRASIRTALPYGVFLAAGAIAAVLI